ncbi:MAG TPA: hypothetical protein VGM74_08000 [Burkholderiaceae bacterium]|jgi:hypothetical protein
MKQQAAPTKTPAPNPRPDPGDVAATPQQATAGLSRQAFRDMLIAAERVNKHHQAQKVERRPS